ncbi:hypothetical protein PENSPDRAFT_646897 [Peniophora sp. CONT]|nr:hypothetical protein PENSPDRAFT_646897 [Peniophora sp. CONT]
MTLDWNDPTLQAAQYLDFIKLQHALGGVYIWELVVGIGYDWRLLRRKQGHAASLWAKWVYLACRYSAMAGFITIFAGYNVSSEINCKIWIIFVFIWAFLAIELASMLIAIRVISIWNKSMIASGLCAVVLATQLGFFIHEIADAKAAWEPIEGTCIVLDTQTSQANVTVTLVTDLFLLLAMLVGLFRWREARSSGLWKIMWHQGLIWLALATIAEVPTVVFVWLNLNQVMNLMFFTPEMVILVIGATRMYRALSTHFTSAYDPSVGYSTSRSEQPDGTPMHRMRSTIAFREVVPLDGEIETRRSDEDKDKRPGGLEVGESTPPRAHSELTYARGV